MKLPVASNTETRKAFGRLIYQHRKLMGASFATQLLGIVFATALPWLTGKTLDWIAAGRDTRIISWAITAMVILVIIRIIFNYIAELLGGIVAEDMFQTLRDQVITQATHLPLSVVESSGSGDLLGRVTYDVRRIQGFMTQGLVSIIQLLLTAIVTYVTALLVAPSLGWTLLVALVPILYTMRWHFSHMSAIIQANAGMVANVSGQISENAGGARIIEAQGLVPTRVKRLHQIGRSMWNLQATTGYTRARSMGAVNTLVMLPLLFTVILGALFIPRGWATIGTVTTVTMLTLQLRAPLTSAMYWITNMQVAWASMQRIAGIGLVPNDRVTKNIAPANSQIDLADVTFAYRADHEVLHGLNLSIKPGERLAIVGTSGAGKSTLARLIAGIDAPTSGSVQIGQAEVTELPEAELHRQVILLTQEHHIFTTTLRENLRLADPAASDEKLWEALDQIGAEWAHQLAERLDTKLGTSAMELTSAQAQQLALARILLADPSTLILDEATSMLDPTSARTLERALGKVLEGRTVIMIAHRLFTAQDADRICVMEDGRIIELGSHEELLSQNGTYSDLWSAWQQK
ncbi:hypothetical protein BSR29_00315 [Boudabousia liubingyangii]|uniref:ABC transporter ATP-binding protein n=1 Tax=Boudabousia liubingyangii TaxID=1921764 RepID=A0A1Q5PPC0_9ACTO|nr:ABC transporter ATP-binding protein [Boudabousia liubingyangii]OKL49448.1 hypothetical protein BSR29_00315 [Boudabousia liubingyangii]